MVQSPLVLSKEDQDVLRETLIDMLRKSEARSAILVDQSGRCITRAGFTENLDVDALAALIAGSFSSTRAMAALVGESEFSVLFHQGQHDHIHNILVDDDRILSVIFDRRTTVGMVRLCARHAAQRLADRFCQVAKRAVAANSEIHRSLAEQTEERIDQIFDAPGAAGGGSGSVGSTSEDEAGPEQGNSID